MITSIDFKDFTNEVVFDAEVDGISITIDDPTTGDRATVSLKPESVLKLRDWLKEIMHTQNHSNMQDKLYGSK